MPPINLEPADTPRGASGTPPLPTAESATVETPNKRQKVTRACDKCKSRKRRCNGELPCKNCSSSQSECTYLASYTRGKIVPPQPSSSDKHAMSLDVAPAGIGATVLERSRANSLEPEGSTFAGQYLGPTSAHSFLQRAWKRFGVSNDASLPARGQDEANATTSIFAFGDRPPSQLFEEAALYLPDQAITAKLMRTYFDFAMPTYRFLHEQTIFDWLAIYHEQETSTAIGQLTEVRQAIVLIVLATALLFHADSDDNLRLESEQLYQAAQRRLDRERNRAKLESVQARLATCLYLLHTSRPNQAWYLLGTTVQLIFALGIHRARHELDDTKSPQERIVSECRKRVFWASATVDTYLSIMLGRPALLHPDDADQVHPLAIDDDDLSAATPAESIASKDSVTAASVLHAKLGRMVKTAAREMYSVQRKSESRKIDTARKLNEEVEAWHVSLPVVLSGAIHASSLIPILRRQVNVLKLAHFHALMFINRPLLLMDKESLAKAQSQVHACVASAKSTLELVSELVGDRTVLPAFWFTQYVAFIALSVVYVAEVQRRRGRLHSIVPAIDTTHLLRLAETVQQHLAEASQSNAPSLRYGVVLDGLRQEATGLSRNAPRGQAKYDDRVDASTTSQGLPAMSEFQTITANDVGTLEDDPLLFNNLIGDFPLDPDLWLHLDAFPFCK